MTTKQTDRPTGELVPADETELVSESQYALANIDNLPAPVREFIVTAMTAVGEQADDSALAIVTAILEADTYDAILANAEVTHLRDFRNRVIEVDGYEFRRSTMGEGPGFYMLLNIAHPDKGTEALCSTGSLNVMAQVYNLARHGLFPCKVRVIEAPPTANGNRPMRLAPAAPGEDF